jgi:thiamine-phosphate pyrophosphorylase
MPLPEPDWERLSQVAEGLAYTVEMVRYAITDRGFSITDVCRWSNDGVDFVQLRAKSLDAGVLAKLARVILADIAEVPGAKTRLLINGRADVAVAVGAAGVHLTAHPDELTPAQVRRVFALAGRPAPVISVSCHMLDEVQRARQAGVDLVLFGPVFEKRVHGEQVAAGVGLEALRAACTLAGEIPVLALGGVTAELIVDCLRAGAKGAAGIRLFG